MSDITHKITAVGSRSAESAQKFIDTLAQGDDTDDYKWSWGLSNGRLEAKAYGNEKDVFTDSVSFRTTPRRYLRPHYIPRYTDRDPLGRS